MNMFIVCFGGEIVIAAMTYSARPWVAILALGAAAMMAVTEISDAIRSSR